MRSVRFPTELATATDYVVGPGARTDARLRTALGDRPVAAIVDEEVAERHPGLVADVLDGSRCVGVLEIRGGEQAKSFGQLEAILGFLEGAALPKHGTVVAIGGGTICDVVGLSAMLMRRSVPLVLVPTTLLAQVDAAVGGKNGINTAASKNMVGHFFHPTVVACDPAFLTTLPVRQLISGIAECTKVFAVSDAVALATHIPRLEATMASLGSDGGTAAVWHDAVWDAMRLKLQMLEADPYERSSKRLLNYGHAFAHLFEERAEYRILHGEAVLLGMMIENEIALELGIAGSEVVDLQDRILALTTPACPEWWIPYEDLGSEPDRLRRMRRNELNLVCLRTPGDAVILDDVAAEVLHAAWDKVGDRLEAAWSGRRENAS